MIVVMMRLAGQDGRYMRCTFDKDYFRDNVCTSIIWTEASKSR